MKKNILLSIIAVLSLGILSIFYSTSETSLIVELNINSIAHAKIVAPCDDHPELSCTWKDGGREHTLTKARPDSPQ